MWCNAIWYDVIWYDVMWCDVIWCDVMWCDAMRCDVCDSMWCEATWRNVTWCDMMWYDAMLCDVMSSFHPQQGTPLTVNEVLQWRGPPGGTTFLWKSATPVTCKLFLPDLRHFYLEIFTTSLPHNLTVCFSWTLADLWTLTIIYTVSDLPYVMRLGMLEWF